MASSSTLLVLPGQPIDLESIPRNDKKPLRLGPGLNIEPPSTLIPTVSGILTSDVRRNIVWVEHGSGRYVPAPGDLVIGTVMRNAGDLYLVSLSDYTLPAALHNLSFEGANKKTRPMLSTGSVVYARVSSAHRHMDAELDCVSATTGKADGLGPLAGGMLFPISLGMARRLLMPKAVQDGKMPILEELGAAGLQFETAVGRNGRLWVTSEKVATTIAVGRAVQDVDEKNLDVKAQKKLARKIMEST
ncbi:Exosome complex component RRP40 [Ceratocystis lukuohia]|uniref:Ribosomal RNA-processing protein 40 n=1 Tax=Ceratocystis lukuohia TaxID=2019550 RepID=A0ABR4MRS8_9PEZI